MFIPDAKSINYVCYHGSFRGSNGLQVLEKDFYNAQKAALSIIKDNKNRLVFYKHDKVKEAEIIFKRDCDENEVIKNSLAIQQRKQPEAYNYLEKESSDIQSDLHFPGSSFWTRIPSLTNLEEDHHYWGIHKTGLILSGNQDSPLKYNENLWQQFYALVVFDHFGNVLRSYNEQKEEVNKILCELKKGPEKNIFLINEWIKAIEKEFVDKNPSIQSKIEFLKTFYMNSEADLNSLKQQIRNNRDFIYTGTEEGLDLLSMNIEKNSGDEVTQ